MQIIRGRCYPPILLLLLLLLTTATSVTSKNLPNVYKNCPKMISLEKSKILTPLQKWSKNEGDLDKIIVARGFKKLPKVQ